MKKPIFLTFLLVLTCLFSSCTSGKQQEPKQKLVHSFDCTKDYPADVYFSHGDVKVVSSPIGSYREAEEAASAADNLQSRKVELSVGTEKLIADIKTALKEGRYAWARRALNSYPIRKTEQLLNVK